MSLFLPTLILISSARFRKGDVAGVWTVEPWVTRLETRRRRQSLGGRHASLTTWLVSSVKFLKNNRDLAKKIAAANAELTQWIQANADEAQKLLIAELKEETKANFDRARRVAQAWKRIKFTTEVAPELITKAVQDGKDAGFLKGSTDTSKLLVSP